MQFRFGDNKIYTDLAYQDIGNRTYIIQDDDWRIFIFLMMGDCVDATLFLVQRGKTYREELYMSPAQGWEKQVETALYRLTVQAGWPDPINRTDLGLDIAKL